MDNVSPILLLQNKKKNREAAILMVDGRWLRYDGKK